MTGNSVRPIDANFLRCKIAQMIARNESETFTAEGWNAALAQVMRLIDKTQTLDVRSREA